MKSLLASLLACLFLSCSTPTSPPTVRANPSTIAMLPPLPSTQAVQRRSSDIATTDATPKSYRLEWDYPGPGPVWFEVWRSNDLGPWSWQGGTNVPVGWTLFATTPKTNAPTVSVPIAVSNVSGFFIVRAVNEFGPSDWAR